MELESCLILIVAMEAVKSPFEAVLHILTHHGIALPSTERFSQFNRILQWCEGFQLSRERLHVLTWNRQIRDVSSRKRGSLVEDSPETARDSAAARYDVLHPELKTMLFFAVSFYGRWKATCPAHNYTFN